MTPQIHKTPGAPDQVAQVPGGQEDIQRRVPGVLHTATTGVATTLDQKTLEFTEADRTNGKLRDFVDQSLVGTIVQLDGHDCEVIPCGELMLSEIIMKDKDEMRDLYLQQWIDTLSDIMKVPGLRVMNMEQMRPIQNDERIFPHGMIYLSSSRTYDDGSYFFWEWNPAYSRWFECSASCTYCKDYNDNYPMALRCIVELS